MKKQTIPLKEGVNSLDVKKWIYTYDFPKLGRIGKNLTEKQKLVLKHFDVNMISERHLDRIDRVKRIKELSKELKRVHFVAPKFIMDTFKDCFDLYSRGKYVASLSLCATICEYYVFWLLEFQIKHKGISNLIQHASDLSKHNGRIIALRKVEAIREKELQSLILINKKRTKYLHLHEFPDLEQQRKDCLEALKNLNTLLRWAPVPSYFFMKEETTQKTLIYLSDNLEIDNGARGNT